MVRLQRREQVKLERHARMAGGHDAMGDELARLVRTEMAIEANIGADRRLVDRPQAARDILFMAGVNGSVRGEPVGRSAMAGFAADAIGLIELWPAVRRRITMATDAFGTGRDIGDAEPRAPAAPRPARAASPRAWP